MKQKKLNSWSNSTVSIIRGAAGEILGGLFGAVIFFIISYVTDSYTAVAAAILIPVFAFGGHILFRGDTRKKYILTLNIIISVSICIITNIIIQCAYFYKALTLILQNDSLYGVKLIDLLELYPPSFALNYYREIDLLGLFSFEELSALTIEMWVTMLISIIIIGLAEIGIYFTAGLYEQRFEMTEI